jgi:hypothetical protein
MAAPRYKPVTPEQASRNCALLLHELTIYEASRRIRAKAERAAAPLAAVGEKVTDSRVAAQAVHLRVAEAEPLDLSAGTGLTPARRAALMASAKARAIEFAIAVRSQNAHMIERFAAGMTADEWKALAITYAAAADSSRLLLVVQTPDDGLPAHLTQKDHIHAA